MLAVYCMLFICSFIAYIARNYIYRENTDGIGTNHCVSVGNVLVFILIVILVWYAGLRTVMNDTGAYINSFRYRIPDTLAGLTQINWSIGANPLFSIYQILLKSIISPNGQVFIFVTSLIVVVSMVRFLLKYSEDFGFSIYFFLAFAVYAFTMAAMKQTLATAIAIWAMPEFVKGKRLKALVIIGIAMLIHPYVILLASGLFVVHRGVWNRTVYLIIFGTVIFSIFFYEIINSLVSITAVIGDEYELDWFATGTGVNILRIIAYLIPSILAFLSRAELRETNAPIQHLFVNMTIIASCLSFLSYFGGSVLIGRLPNYFDIFICIAFTFVLNHLSHSLDRIKYIIKIVLIIAYFVFYTTYYWKYHSMYGYLWTADFYFRTGIGTLFQR